MSSRRGYRLLLAFLVLCLLFSIFTSGVFAGRYPREGEISVFVYVVCLDGVPAYGVENMSEVFEGVLQASSCNVRYNTREFDYSCLYPYPIYKEFLVNASVVKVTDWMAYRFLVEYGRNIIIVNAHGEILPVPSPYTRDEWVDKIAEGMLDRNMTWIHVAGYPFRYCWLQGNQKEEEWGEDGFKQLMRHVGRENATCYPPEDLEDLGWKLIYIHPWANDYYLEYPMLVLKAFLISLWGFPLYEPDFEGLLVPPGVYCYADYGYLPAATIKFSRGEESYSFGFYVHFGVEQTYSIDEEETDRDFCAGYVAAAMAIKTYVLKVFAGKFICEAENSILAAEREGRIKGLEKARVELSEAKNEFFNDNSYEAAVQKAREAKALAEEAIKPSILELYGPQIGMACILIAIGTGTAILWKNKHKNKEKVEENEEA